MSLGGAHRLALTASFRLSRASFRPLPPRPVNSVRAPLSLPRTAEARLVSRALRTEEDRNAHLSAPPPYSAIRTGTCRTQRKGQPAHFCLPKRSSVCKPNGALIFSMYGVRLDVCSAPTQARAITVWYRRISDAGSDTGARRQTYVWAGPLASWLLSGWRPPSIEAISRSCRDCCSLRPTIYDHTDGRDLSITRLATE